MITIETRKPRQKKKGLPLPLIGGAVLLLVVASGATAAAMLYLQEQQRATATDNGNEYLARLEDQRAATATLAQELKANPQPLFDLAAESVKAGVAQESGDTEAAATAITVDQKTLQSFGGEKWQVRGQLRSPSHATTWAVTMEIKHGKLYATLVRLQVD